MRLRFIKEIKNPSVKGGIVEYGLELVEKDIKLQGGFTDIKITDEEIDSLVNSLLELREV